MPAGGFVDWSCDADFADFDNDGDLDLFHSSYGSSFGGSVPSRVFLNDGDGRFSEFNPSGFQLAGSTLAAGSPGLWCEGTHTPSTLDATGVECDVTTNTLDIDMGDVDGDLDLDVLHGDRDNPPRFFHNRLEENGGVLGFRDVTSLVFPPGYTAGFGGNYDQELGDVDDDGDLDLFGLNWPELDDALFRKATSSTTTTTGTSTSSSRTSRAGTSSTATTTRARVRSSSRRSRRSSSQEARSRSTEMPRTWTATATTTS
jgi:hypothetical protein